MRNWDKTHNPFVTVHEESPANRFMVSRSPFANDADPTKMLCEDKNYRVGFYEAERRQIDELEKTLTFFKERV